MSPSVGKSNKSMKICYLFNFSASGTTFSFTHKKKKKKKRKKKQTGTYFYVYKLTFQMVQEGRQPQRPPWCSFADISRNLIFCPWFVLLCMFYPLFHLLFIYISFITEWFAILLVRSHLFSLPILYTISLLCFVCTSLIVLFFLLISLFPHLSSSCLKIIRRSFILHFFQSYFERLSKPHGNCSDGTQTNFTSEEYTYTTRACVKSCVQQHIFNKCGCVTDIMMNDTICSPRNQTERTYPLHLCGFV